MFDNRSTTNNLFLGVVENRDDPEFLGRCKVRIYGIHSEDRDVLPTKDLPWSLPLMDITTSGVTGIGRSPTGLLEGSWVAISFLDGLSGQVPIILGSLPSNQIPHEREAKSRYTETGEDIVKHKGNEEYDTETGFFDPLNIYPLYNKDFNGGKPPKNPYSTPAEGVGLSTEQGEGFVMEETHVGFKKRFDILVKAVNDDLVELKIPEIEENYWVEEETKYQAEYPQNHAFKSESGHIKEYDDTPGRERIHEMHRSGTFYEISPDGSKVEKIYGKNFEIVLDDDHIAVGGDRSVTVKGDANIFVGGDVNMRTEGNFKHVVKGSYEVEVCKDIKFKNYQAPIDISSVVAVGISADYVNQYAGVEMSIGGHTTKIDMQGAYYIKTPYMSLESPNTLFDGNIIHLGEYKVNVIKTDSICVNGMPPELKGSCNMDLSIGDPEPPAESHPKECPIKETKRPIIPDPEELIEKRVKPGTP